MKEAASPVEATTGDKARRTAKAAALQPTEPVAVARLGSRTAPGQLLQLQRLIGNRAVNRVVSPNQRNLVVQRKYEDLDLTTVDKDLGAKIGGMFRRYNTTALLSKLEEPERSAQRDRDIKALKFISDTINDVHGEALETPVIKGWITKINETLSKLSKSESDKRLEENKVATTTGPIAFTNFPKMAEPRPFESIMPGVEFIEATINGEVYHLYAGQDYLNAGYSQKLYHTAPTKTGNIDIYVSQEQVSPKFKNATIGDAHHRFVWGAKHNQPMVANLIPRGIPTKIFQWQELTYTHNPKHVFKYDPKNPILTKVFNAALSPLPQYAGRFEGDPLEFARGIIKDLLKIPEVIFVNRDDEKIRGYLTDLVSKSQVGEYQEKIMAFQEAAGNKVQAKSTAEILLESFPAGEAPNVALGPTPSIGYYSPDYHVIVLDPVKNPTADALLDTLAFEIGNAIRREDFLSDKKATAGIEFGTMGDYINLLLESTHSGTIDSLVFNLGIPKQFLIPGNADVVLKMKEPALDMPEKSELPGQKLRSALAWWKMQDWTDGQRKQYFTTSAHAEGLEATGAGYKSTDDSTPKVKVTSATKSQPCFKLLLQEMVRHYPRADSYDFNALTPRQFGEFLMTSQVKRWQLEPMGDTGKVSQAVIEELHRDLKKVYVNKDAMDFSSLTFTDYGDFMLTGQIKSWEKM